MRSKRCSSSSGLRKPCDGSGRVALRQQAFDWLKAERAVWAQLAESGSLQTRAKITQILRHWQQDADLAGVREGQELAKLPEAIRDQAKQARSTADAKRTPEQKKLLAGIVNPLMPTLNQLFDKVLAIPGVSDLLKPTIDLLKAKLAMLTS